MRHLRLSMQAIDHILLDTSRCGIQRFHNTDVQMFRSAAFTEKLNERRLRQTNGRSPIGPSQWQPLVSVIAMSFSPGFVAGATYQTSFRDCFICSWCAPFATLPARLRCSVPSFHGSVTYSAFFAAFQNYPIIDMIDVMIVPLIFVLTLFPILVLHILKSFYWVVQILIYFGRLSGRSTSSDKRMVTRPAQQGGWDDGMLWEDLKQGLAHLFSEFVTYCGKSVAFFQVFTADIIIILHTPLTNQLIVHDILTFPCTQFLRFPPRFVVFLPLVLPPGIPDPSSTSARYGQWHKDKKETQSKNVPRVICFVVGNSSYPHLLLISSSSPHLLIISSSYPHLLISTSPHIHISSTSPPPIHISSSYPHLLHISSSYPHLLLISTSPPHLLQISSSYHILLVSSSAPHILFISYYFPPHIMPISSSSLPYLLLISSSSPHFLLVSSFPPPLLLFSSASPLFLLLSYIQDINSSPISGGRLLLQRAAGGLRGDQRQEELGDNHG